MLLIDPTTLALQVDNYFEQVRKNGKFTIGVYDYEEEYPTLSGLAIFLGFTSTSQFKKYREDPEYTDIIDSAMLRVYHQYEKKFQEGNANAKIALKRFDKDWDDSTEMKHSFTFADMVKRISEGKGE